MFRKHTKKVFPPGTFIPLPARVCAIVQLCLAFSLALWVLSQPFSGEWFQKKSTALLYEDLMGIASKTDLLPEQASLLHRNRAKFAQLPSSTKTALQQGYRSLLEGKERSFLDKLSAAIRTVLRLSIFKTAWILLSIVLPILLLKRVEGAPAAIWILPLLALCYLIDNQMHGHTVQNQEAQLFPLEKQLVEEYVKTSLSSSIFEQQKQLKQAWEHYLVQAWGEQTPASDPGQFKQQLESAQYAFNLARIEKRALDDKNSSYNLFEKEHPAFLLLYLLWNVLFAGVVTKKLLVVQVSID